MMAGTLFSLCRKILPAAGVFLFLLTLPGGETLTADWEKRTAGLTPSVREHLKFVLTELSQVETGRFLEEKVSPDISFSAKPMAQLGVANPRNEITLESLRLENTVFPAGTERQKKNKACFTAEILAHELLHNAQFRAGLFRFPPEFSGFEASLCERLLEMQAKYVGEKSFFLLSGRPDYQRFVQPKPGLFLVMQRRSQEPEKEYEETLWKNARTFADGTPIYKGQLREIRYWNTAYTEQAFRNHYRRFAADLPGAGESALREHMEKILRFTAMPLDADFLLKNAAIRPIPHGISCWENGVKILELEATAQGAVRRVYQGTICQETAIPFAGR